MAEFVTLNGFDIRFEIHGEGIPIVYTPGGFYPLEKGRLLAERLKPLGYKVLLWDRPNTGASGLLFAGDNIFQIWADKLCELLHYTEFSPAFVAGGSAGGLGSLCLACHYPAEVRGLIFMAPPTDNKDFWNFVIQSTFLAPAKMAEKNGMSAALEAQGGMGDLFIWQDQFQRVPQKRQQLLSMNPLTFAQVMRTWANSLTASGHPHLAGLSDGQLAAINTPTIIFSGASEDHPQHTAEALHKKLAKSELVITTEYYAETMDQILRDCEEKGDEYFDAAFVERIDEFVRAVLSA
jgi:pimeloyl-ACP methyl ester carboxylesterase